MSGLGNLCKIAGAAVGTYFCPGLGTAIGSAAGSMVGDVIDGKSDKKSNEVAQNNSIFNPTELLNGVADPTKLISIFGV